MRSRHALRILNERPSFLGLSMWDLCWVGYTLIIFHSVLEPFGLGVLSFGVAGLLGYGLMVVRLKLRPKIIRDSVKFILTAKVIYDPTAQ